MGAAANIDFDSALPPVLYQNTYTLTRLRAHALTAPLAAEFVDFQAAWMQVNAQEIEIEIEIRSASALIAGADDDLDVLVDAVSNALLILTDNKDDVPLYTSYFRGKLVSELKRPVLSWQLEFMRDWISPLKKSPAPSLNALGAELEQKVAAADAAKKALAAAEAKNREFRLNGARKELIDQFNALRKRTFGKLGELPHTHPEANLPGSFANRFFRRVSRPKVEPAPPTSDELKTMITEAEAHLLSLRDQLKEKLEREDAEAKAEREQEANDEAIARMEEEHAALAATIAAAKAKQKER